MTEQRIARREPATDLDVFEVGRMMAQSGFFADTKDAAQAVVKILAGRELGFGPVASMTGIHIVQGRVTMSANLIGAAIKRSGRYDYRVRELTDQACQLEFYEKGDAVGVSAFTWADAERAQLAGKATWKQYPRNLLFARAMSNGARFYCPDVFGGPIYTPEELGAGVEVGHDGEALVAAPPATNGHDAPDPGPDLPRMAALRAEMDAAVAEGKSEEWVKDLMAQHDREQGSGKPFVPADDVESLSGTPLRQACERLRRQLVARNLPYPPYPRAPGDPALRDWWHQSALVLDAPAG